MNHRTLVSGTAYNISGGKSMVSGTVYDITGGKTLVSGTGYNIGFGGGNDPTAMLYSDGNMVFQLGGNVESGKTLTASYTGFEDVSYMNSASVPWNSQRANIKNVSYGDGDISPASMAYWFYRCYNLTGSPVCGNNVTNMAYAFYQCYNLTGSPVCGNNVTNMAYAYRDCGNITGSSVCGNNVTNMAYAYMYCYNLTSPVCGNNVTNMAYAYSYCYNLTGSPVCGNNVTNMDYAYRDCNNITGSPVCSSNVKSMVLSYSNCYNLTGVACVGQNVTNAYCAYRGCNNISGNAYIYSTNVVLSACFKGRSNNSKKLNIYVPANSTTATTVLYKNTSSLVGANITYTNAGTYHYNTYYNIYIYPVANVAAARFSNGDDENSAESGTGGAND